MGKYIINFEDNPGIAPDREKYYKCCEIPWWVAAKSTLSKLTPYTEPDLERVRKEAYAEGYKEGMQLSIDDAKLKEAYQRGLADAWECARKIANMYSEERRKIFGENFIQKIHSIYSASEAIEKIRVYEQEQEKSARVEYNYTEVKDVIETTAKEYNMSLDEIAEVLKKMGEH